MNSLRYAEETKVEVQKENEQTLVVLRRIRVIEDKKIFAELGYSSIWEFATGYLGYDEGQSSRRIGAARLIRDFPEVEEKIKTRKMSLTVAAMTHTFIKRTKFSGRDVLSRVEGKSVRSTQRLFLEMAPEAIPNERVRPLSGNKTEYRIIADAELTKDLEDLKALRSHLNPGMGITELIKDMAKFCKRHWDPAQRRSRATSAARSDKRQPPSATESLIWKRDSHGCTYVSPLTGKRCGSKHLIECDHIIPWSRGGGNEPENMRLLCKTHNQLRIRQL